MTFVITPDDVDEFASIINNLSSGETVLIRNGVYEFDQRLNFDHKEGITIQNYPEERPTLKYVGSDDNVINIGTSAAYLTFKGLRIVRASSSNGCVFESSGKVIRIIDNEICFDPQFAVSKYDAIKLLKDSEFTLIDRCIIHDCPQQGIDTVGGNFIVASNNVIYNCGNAIVLKGGSIGNLIINNSCFNLKYGGIGLGGVTDKEWIDYEHEIVSSIAIGNTVWYSNPNNRGGSIFLAGAYNCLVKYNSLFGSGIHLFKGGDPDDPDFQFYCKNNHIEENTIVCNGNDGILAIEEGNEDGLQLLRNIYCKVTDSCTGEFKVGDTWYDYETFKSLFDFDNDSIFVLLE